jgi:hypothetical protein
LPLLKGGFFMLHVLQQLPLIPNEFHILSATPCDMECNMKQLPDKAGIAETIAIALCPLRRSKTMAQAQARAETAITMLRKQASQPFPDAASVRKAAESLRKAVEPLGDEQQLIQIPDGHIMTMRELRFVLDWFEGLKGPSSKVDVLKRFVATQADCIVFEFSEERDGWRLSDVASLLYEAVTGEADVKLKHQIDAVRRSWKFAPDGSKLDELRCRGIPRLR